MDDKGKHNSPAFNGNIGHTCAMLAQLPPELFLHIVSFLTRETFTGTSNRLERPVSQEPAPVPDLSSINALSRVNTAFHRALNQHLYTLCASFEPLGELALLFAVEHQLETTFDKLVAAGISPSSTSEYGSKHGTWMFLHIAATKGSQTIFVKLLKMLGHSHTLPYSEELMARVHTRTRASMTALDYAAHFGHMEIVRLLAPIPMPSNHASLETEEEYLSIPETQDEYLSIALLESARGGHLAISEYLVAEGADVNFVREGFYTGTALFLAAQSSVALVQFLLNSGADPNLHRLYGTPPLFNASSVHVRQALVSAGADIHAKDDISRNLLAYRTGDIEMLAFALRCGIDPNNEDDFGQTPLHNACNQLPSEAYAAVQALLQFGATTVEKTDADGHTPVHLAMRMDNSEVVEILEPLVQNPRLKLKIATWQKEREL